MPTRNTLQRGTIKMLHKKMDRICQANTNKMRHGSHEYDHVKVKQRRSNMPKSVIL